MEIETRLQNNEVALLKSGGYFTCAQSEDLTGGVVFLFFRSIQDIYYRVFRLKIPREIWPSWLNYQENCVHDFTFALCSKNEKNRKCCNEVPLALSNNPYFTLSPRSTISLPSELFSAGEVLFVEENDSFISWLKHPLIDNAPCTNFEIDSEWIPLYKPPVRLKELISCICEEDDLLDSFLKQVPDDPDQARKELFVAFMHIFSFIENVYDDDDDDDDDELSLIIYWNPPLPYTCSMYFAIKELYLHNRGRFLDDVMLLVESKVTLPENAREQLGCIWWCVHNNKLPDSDLYESYYDRQMYLENVLHKLCSSKFETTNSTPVSDGFFSKLLHLYGIDCGDFETFLKDVCMKVKTDGNLEKLVDLYADTDYLHLLEEDLESAFENLTLSDNHFMTALFDQYVSR